MPRSPITEMIVKLNTLAEQIHALPEDERNYLLDLLLPEEEPTPKKASKKRGRKAGKSPRANSIADKIGGPSGNGLCTFTYDDGSTCLAIPSNAIHDKSAGYAGYHEFQPSAAKAASGG